jgi:hypothetical protein
MLKIVKIISTGINMLLMAWNAHPAAKAWIAKQPAKSSKK